MTQAWVVLEIKWGVDDQAGAMAECDPVAVFASAEEAEAYRTARIDREMFVEGPVPVGLAAMVAP